MRALYINGQAADLDSNTKVDISYKTPLFTDITSLEANSTYTIKLPMTAKNKRLIGNAHIVSVVSSAPYDFLRVDYVADGYEVISNGRGCLLSVSDGIEIAVLFGGIPVLAKLKEVKLPKMAIKESGKTTWFNAGFAKPDQYTADGICFLDLDFGSGIEGNIESAHPSITAYRVLTWIAEGYNLRLGELVTSDWYIPCLTKNRREGDLGSVVIRQKSLDGYPDWRTFKASGEHGLFRAAADGTIKIQDSVSGVEIAIHFAWTAADGSKWSGPAQSVQVTEYVGDLGEQVFLSENAGSVKIDTIPGARYKIEYRPFDVAPGASMIYEQLTVTPPADQLVYGEQFDVLANLPDISVTDFLKALMQLRGVFAVQDPEGLISFKSVDDLYANIPRAKDWSGKLQEIKSIEYRYSKFAQRNLAKWEDEENITVNDEGVLTVDNKSIEQTADLFKSKFAPCDVGEGRLSDSREWPERARVPIYTTEYDKDNGGLKSYKLNKLKPRIVADHVCQDGRWGKRRYGKVIRLGGADGLIAKHYGKYQELIRRPKLVKAVVRLDSRDLAELDFFVPVYLEQLGEHYAVMAVNAKEKGAEVELLRL